MKKLSISEVWPEEWLHIFHIFCNTLRVSGCSCANWISGGPFPFSTSTLFYPSHGGDTHCPASNLEGRVFELQDTFSQVECEHGAGCGFSGECCVSEAKVNLLPKYIYIFLLSMTVAVQARQCKLQVCLFRYLSDQTRLLSDFWCPLARSGGSEPSSCWPRPTRLWMRPSACPSNMRCPLPSWQMHPSTCWNVPASQALRWQVNISLSTRCSAAVYYNFFWHQCTSSLSCSFFI